MITDEEIARAKQGFAYKYGGHHLDNDCIRIAYQWLSAQTILKHRSRKRHELKHLIERWAGSYVSTSDVEIAAHLHPEIFGKYPYFNIHGNLLFPPFRPVTIE